MVAIVRACVDVRFKMVIGVLPAQSGKSEGAYNVIGHRLDDDPVPILYIGPTQKYVESVSTDKIMKMFRSVASLWDKLAKGKRNKVTEKWVAGVRLGFGWAGSATEISGHAAGLVVVDERDRMEDIKGEGDPVELARARLTTYSDGMLAVFSTPKVGNVQPVKHPVTGLEHWGDLELADDAANAGASPIWKLWQEGTRFEWAWPCPHCAEYFIPRLSLLTWPKDSTPAQVKKAARLTCARCGALIEESAKAGMNARAVFVAPGQSVVNGKAVGEIPPNEKASFWVSGLCSPWKSFGDRASAFVAAVQSGSPARIQGVINLEFGELYRVGGEAPAWQTVRDLRQAYESGTVPEGVQVITCSVDVQKRRLVYSVRGWGWNLESWGIEAGDIWGETEHDAIWGELAKLLERDFGGKRIRLMTIDSGYKPGEKDRNPDNQIYLFCRRFRGRAVPTKGHDTQDKPFRAAKIDVSHRGKIFKNGLDLWHLDTDYFKSWVHARLEWPKGQPGGWHLPSDATEDYCKQIVAEHRTVAPSGRVVWVKVRAENHYLDVEAGNAAAAHILRLHALPKPKSAEPAPDSTGAAPDSAPPQEPTAKPQPPAQKPRQFAALRRPNFTTGWRR